MNVVNELMTDMKYLADLCVRIVSFKGENKMFCKNCGKEIDEKSKYCQNCGTPVNSSPAVNINVVRNEVSSKNILHYAAIISCILVLILSLTKWLELKCWYISGDYSAFGFRSVIKTLSDFGDMGLLTIFSVVLIVCCVLILGLNAYYLVRLFSASSYSENNDHVVCGYNVMMITGIVYICLFLFTIILSTPDQYGVFELTVNTKLYVIVAITVANRFFLLPKYNEILYYEDKYKKENESVNKAPSKARTAKQQGWMCEFCDTLNEDNRVFCKNCNEYKSK